MNLRIDDVPVLQAALRTRILEPARLAEIVRMPVADVRETLDRLAADGLVVRTADGHPALPPPQRAIVAAALAELGTGLTALEDARDALATLPGRLRDWAGAHGGDRAEVPMELSHGPDAIVDAWWRLREHAGPVDAFGCFSGPGLVRLASESGAVAAPPGSRIRILVERAGLDATTESAAAALSGQGAELRTLEGTPGWFAGQGGDRSAFPTAWGVPWPMSVRVLRDPVASGSLRSFFDELWRRAIVLDGPPAPWEAVLRLLAEGLDDAAVAEALGLSERTVRRRVDEAMLDLGATNRFTLARRWASRRVEGRGPQEEAAAVTGFQAQAVQTMKTLSPKLTTSSMLSKKPL